MSSMYIYFWWWCRKGDRNLWFQHSAPSTGDGNEHTTHVAP